MSVRALGTTFKVFPFPSKSDLNEFVSEIEDIPRIVKIFGVQKREPSVRKDIRGKKHGVMSYNFSCNFKKLRTQICGRNAKLNIYF